MATLREQWETEPVEDRLALLAAAGRKAAVRRNRELAALYKARRGNLWSFCVARALVESTHARAQETWYPAAARFLETGAREDLVPARGHSSSFGPDALQRALTSFRAVGNLVGLPRAQKFDAAGLCAMQDRAVQYAMQQNVSGLGAWLFCAPFELLALVKPSLWEDERLDGLLLPLGSPVARGYGLLQSAGLVEVEEQLLRDSEPGLRNGLTLLYIARGAAGKLARQAETRALFLHHGIQELGRVR